MSGPILIIDHWWASREFGLPALFASIHIACLLPRGRVNNLINDWLSHLVENNRSIVQFSQRFDYQIANAADD
jgi:hypothetical protein